MLFTKKSLILEYYHFTISHNHVIQNHVCLCLQSALHTTPLVAANLSLISETRCWCHTASIAQEYITISIRFIHEIYEHFTKIEIDCRKPILFYPISLWKLWIINILQWNHKKLPLITCMYTRSDICNKQKKTTLLNMIERVASNWHEKD